MQAVNWTTNRSARSIDGFFFGPIVESTDAADSTIIAIVEKSSGIMICVVVVVRFCFDECMDEM